MPSTYFPPLDRCLAGEERLTAWKTAHQALSRIDTAGDNDALQSFLNDSEAISRLSSILDPFHSPSQQTKSDFETKTAPIQVSSSANGDYDLDTLKKDALWLSREVNLEEVTALRIVVLEWQQRAEGQLRHTAYGSERSLASTRSDLQNSSLRSSSLNPGTPITGVNNALDFGKEEVRRDRQLALYLEERSYILRTGTDLVNRVAIPRSSAKKATSWLDDLAHNISSNQRVSDPKNTHDTFCRACVDFVSKDIQQLEDQNKWPAAFTSSVSRQLVYQTATFIDVATALQLLLSKIHTLDAIPGHHLVSSWFDLIGSKNFFQSLPPSPALRDPSSIQCLVSLISVAVLQAPEVIKQVQDAAAPLVESRSGWPQLPVTNNAYFRNDDCMKEVNMTFYRAAQQNTIIAAPAIYAWSLITGLIRDIAKMQHEMREQARIDLESSDSEAAPVRRRASARGYGDEVSTFEKQYTLLQDIDMEVEVRDDPPLSFARLAVDVLNVHGVISQIADTVKSLYDSENDVATSYNGRLVLLELVREGMPMISYGAEVLEAILTILSPEVPGRSTSSDTALADRFIRDQDVFVPAILDQAIARYPFELSPFIRLLSALAAAHHSDAVLAILEGLQTLTVMVPEHFRAYVLDHEDENVNSMLLTNALPLFISKQALAYYGRSYLGRPELTMGSDEEGKGSNVLAIPSGASGVVVKESRPLVLRIEHPHSGLEYLGLLLSTLLPNSQILVVPMKGATFDRSTAAEIITLITILTGCFTQTQSVEQAHHILGRFAHALGREEDIITVISDIFEIELLAHLDQSIQDGSLDVLIACAEFFTTLTKISPERVWSFLSHSSLLGISGGVNALAAVVAGTEVQTGRYRFLAACIKIYSHLMDDAVAGLVRRKTTRSSKNGNGSLRRFDSPIESTLQDSGTPERTIINVLNAFETVVVDAWQSLSEWRFVVLSEKCEIATLILKIFERLLTVTYGVEGAERGISSLLWSSATALLDTLAPEVGNEATLQSLSDILKTGLSTDESDSILPSQLPRSVIQQTTASLEFLTTLIRTVRMVDSTGQRPYSLGAQLLNEAPTFAILMASDHAFKSSLSALLTEVAQALNNPKSRTEDPPSLLGHLPIDAIKAFLTVICHLDRPLQNISVETRIWDFLSTIMSSRQKWLAIYLLTGALPRDKVRSREQDKTPSKSLLTYALDQLSGIKDLPPPRATALLKFVASAQYMWIWATNEVRSHSDFLKSSLGWLDGLTGPSKAPSITQELLLADEHQMAAYLCDILAVNVHASWEVGDKTVLKMLTPKLGFLRDYGVGVSAFNRSLHHNLSENFSRRFTACTSGVEAFKRTSANPASFGREYFYDRDLANAVLEHEKAWYGAQNNRNQGFSEEFARANVNLSLIEAQTRLLRSWTVLSTTLCECLDQDAALSGELAKTAASCLNANVETNLDQQGMDSIVRMRADMAFVIVSKLVCGRTEDPAMKALLPVAWELVKASPVDYDVAVAAEDLGYYRTLLQVLYLAIQPHVYLGASTRSKNRDSNATEDTKVDFLDPKTAACLLNIMTKTIAPGFRALCGNLHESVTLAIPGDFGLLIALLQAVLSVRGVSAVHPQLAEVVANTSLVRSALSLYSWSDQLAELTDQDPIYGEVAAMFLLALSSVTPVAEQMAIDGALLQLSSANLSNYFRKAGGKGPFGEPRRMFVIWSEAFLPLCLNLLDAVGAPIAAEISNFLNSFPEQLNRAQVGLENREASRHNPHAGAITLSLVSEAQNLCFIAQVLVQDKALGAAEGINAADVPPLGFDYAKVMADAAGLTRQKTSLASRVVPIGERETAWMAEGVKGDNALVNKIIGVIEEI